MGTKTAQRPGLPPRAAHVTIAWALILGARKEGTTVLELEKAAGVSNRNAARWLERLCRSGFMARQRATGEGPHYKGYVYAVNLTAIPAYASVVRVRRS